MKVVALISGGKDSCYNMMQCVAHGHEIVALANLRPKDKDELDSYMYQTVGHHAIDLYADAMNLPLYRRTIEGSSVSTEIDYYKDEKDEVEDLYKLLKEVKEKECIDAVSVGAILSNYQRIRVENVCNRLGLMSLAYLWQRNQSELLKEMIDCGVEAIIIKVASLGLEPMKHLGMSIKKAYPDLIRMRDECYLNVCGEGGEYETFTLDCPLFNKKLVLVVDEVCLQSEDPVASVGYMNLKKLDVFAKTDIDICTPLKFRLQDLPLMRAADIHMELNLSEVQDFPSSTVHSQLSIESENIEPNILTTTAAQNSSQSIYVSGLYGLTTGSQTIENETKSLLDKLSEILSKQLFRMSEIVIMHLYVRKMSDFSKINEAYSTYFDMNPPARVCVETCLPHPISVQIDCYACKCNNRKTLHIQGLSHWAPANIGPYSQAVQVNNRIYVAGQIGLCPSSLTLITGGIVAECRLSLRHVSRVLKAMQPRCQLNHILLNVCYVTDVAHIKHARDEWRKALLEDEIHVKSNFSPLLEFVVVTHLPKSALVEWQVISSVDISIYEAVRRDELTSGSLIAAVEILSCDENDNNAMLCDVASLNASNTVSNDMTVLLSSLWKSCGGCNLPTLWTIFYKNGSISLQALQTVFKEIADCEIALNFVSVIGFESYNQLVSICV